MAFLVCRNWQRLSRILGDPLVSISLSQRAPFPSNNRKANVYHGLPADLHRFHPKPQGYLAFLGRMSPEKFPPDVAIRIARRLGMPLRMAAKVDPSIVSTLRPRLCPFSLIR